MSAPTQAAPALLMVRPAWFGFDPQTAASNAFQQPPADSAVVRERAVEEFDAMVTVLRANDIKVVVIEDTNEPPKPDAIFPNNWLSTWPDERVYLYPMCAPNRRLERRSEVIEQLRESFKISKVTDISAPETTGRFLEGTGAIVFDHPNRRAYACLSPRCDKNLFNKHCKQLGYEPIAFAATDETGTPIYHTNVLVGVQTSTAVACLEAIGNREERDKVRRSLAENHKVITITPGQMHRFAGNILEVQNARGKQLLILSHTAFDVFTPQQRTALARDKQLVPVAIPTIERIGGGSARCMVAEIFLPQP